VLGIVGTANPKRPAANRMHCTLSAASTDWQLLELAGISR
jgi:hypothetical protein